MSFKTAWNNLLTGDHVKIKLKDPASVGIVSTTESLTYQRLDNEDLKTLELEGYIIRKDVLGMQPVTIEFIEVNVIKKIGNKQKFVVYFLLKEEIEFIKFL